jgi:Mn2+/Fe2+ NRAMP family transporter
MTSTPTHQAASRPAAADLTGARRGVDLAFAVLMIAFTVAVFVQIYLAGAGAFAHHSGTHVVHHAFSAHEDLGHYLGIASGVLFILALIAHVNRSTMIGALFLVLTTEVAQEGLASAGHHNRWVGGLHAFDAGVILVLAIWLSIAAYKRRLAR